MKNKHQKKQSNTVKQKAMIDSLIFQTNWGIKKIYNYPTDSVISMANAELNSIIELKLFEDLLTVKKFVDDVKSVFYIEPVTERGDFCRSLATLALGIGRMGEIIHLNMPADWKRLAEKKILSIYYPNDVRNSIVDYAKQNGYNVSTYLGKPMIKFSNLFLLIERAR
jgi:hypothetical protein